MIFFKVYFYLDLIAFLWIMPILIMYCFIPNKGIKEGLTEWFNEDL